MKSISLVLGGTGFLGSHIAHALVRAGHTVRVLALDPGPITGDPSIDQEIECFWGDLGDVDLIKKALPGVKMVFHYAGTTLPENSNRQPIYDVESNLVGTIRFLEEASRHEVEKIVFSSSGGTVYGIPKQIPIPETHPTNPICSYGITKLAIEKYLLLFSQLYGFDVRIMRYGNPYGERQDPRKGQGAIAVFLWRILEGRPIEIWGDGNVVRDFFYVGDLVSATMQVLEITSEEKVFNVGSGQGISINDLMEIISQCTGIEPTTRYLPSRFVDVPSNVLDISLIQKKTGWEPTVGLREGIARTWQWLQVALKEA